MTVLLFTPPLPVSLASWETLPIAAFASLSKIPIGQRLPVTAGRSANYGVARGNSDHMKSNADEHDY
ncbi:hypothetical protein PAXINDRAFT_22354 [Paxillus involutus ATCC 200175]|uniref:Uncharacterized protein n=1 Tax=Paxillus involutus ATCC 200175 TaxID=664439 RepID=A0A0C9SLG0_PAXIN|nr:hypothetical protein PAXINDRAFT_22354 [Paxillus involutus ATCC 200175]